MKKVYVLAICLASLILGLLLDKEIFTFIVNHRVGFLNNFMVWITYWGTLFTIFFVISSLFMWYERKRQWILPLWFSLGASILIAFLLKYIVGRVRPDVFLNAISLVRETTPSFPSAHAAAVFSAIPILEKEHLGLRIFWVLLAILIAYSRMYVGVHYLTDVAFGALIGYFCGELAVYLNEKSKLFKTLNFFGKGI